MGTIRYSGLSPTDRPAVTLNMTPARLAVLDFMQDYDVIPSTYIKSHLPHWHGTRIILAALLRGHYITIPYSLRGHPNARKRVRALALDARGIQALKDAGLWRNRVRMNDHDAHAYLRSVIQYSFDRAPLEIPGLTLHKEAAIIAHPNTPAATKTDPNPSWFSVDAKSNTGTKQQTIRPDAPIFGYEYQGTHMYFQGFEADRATERLTAKPDFRRKTIKAMFSAYADYAKRQLCMTKYGIPRVTFLLVTVGDQRVANMIATLKDTVPDERIQKWFAFKSIPDFLHDGALPPPTAHMVTEPWHRVDGPFSILETLKATAKRKANGRREEVSQVA
jgi:hypothetical protein